jgi:hypothetical protein
LLRSKPVNAAKVGSSSSSSVARSPMPSRLGLRGIRVEAVRVAALDAKHPARIFRLAAVEEARGGAPAAIQVGHLHASRFGSWV